MQRTYNDNIGWLSYLGNNDVKKVDITNLIIVIIFTMMFVMVCFKAIKNPMATHWNIAKQKVWSSQMTYVKSKFCIGWNWNNFIKFKEKIKPKFWSCVGRLFQRMVINDHPYVCEMALVAKTIVDSWFCSGM